MIAKQTTADRVTHTSAEENLVRLRRRQDRYLPKMMRLCAAAHPYYGPLMKKLGLTPDDFRTVEDLRKLPPLPKKEYANDPEAFRLDLEGVPGLSPEETTLADIVYTAGSTSKPAPFYDTVHDRFARVQLMGRAAAIGGVGPDDTVMNLFPLSSVPHQGFLSASWGAMASGAKLLTGLTGRAYAEIPVHHRMDEAIEVAERQRATVLWGITTYIRRFVMRAQELGKDFSSVRIAMVMGEPCPPFMREDIRTRLMAMGSEGPDHQQRLRPDRDPGPRDGVRGARRDAPAFPGAVLLRGDRQGHGRAAAGRRAGHDAGQPPQPTWYRDAPVRRR